MVANLSARVGSIGDNRSGGWYSYRASKAAVNQLTRCMSLEFERRKQRVAAILLHPGTVDTDLSKPFQKVGGQAGGVERGAALQPAEPVAPAALTVTSGSRWKHPHRAPVFTPVSHSPLFPPPAAECAA